MATTPPQTLVNVSADPALNTIYPATAQNIPPVTNATIYITDKTEYITNIINSTVAGGETDEVQFNVGDRLVGDSGLRYDMDTDTLTVSGNVVAGNLKTDHILYANGTAWSFGSASYSNTNVASYLVTYTGNINANTITASIFSGNHYGNGTGITSIAGANVTGVVANATYATSAGSATSANTATSATTAGTVTTAAQPNITSVGTLTGLTVTATISGNITGNANYANTAGSTTTAGTVTTAAQPNITSVGTLTGLTVSGELTLQANSVLSIANITQSTNTTTGALKVVGGIASQGNIHANHIHALYTLNAGQHLFAGNNAQGSSFQSQVMVGKDTATSYVQSAMVNSADTGSADWIAYGESGDDEQGWNDFGYTGTNFNDANYTITKASDGYIFTQGMSGQGGNLVLATGETGAVGYRDIVFATGGFLATDEKLRLSHANDSLIPYANVTMNLGDSTHYYNNVFVTNIKLANGATIKDTSGLAVAFGENAGTTNQGTGGVAIGHSSGKTNQGQYSVAIGDVAGNLNQGNLAIAIGSDAGLFNQGIQSIAIGSLAGANTQGEYSIAIGAEAGDIVQANNAIAIGAAAGTNNQGYRGIAIGVEAGASFQGTESVAIGNSAGRLNQEDGAIAIGDQAGAGLQGLSAIALGLQAGYTTQGSFAIAIGHTAGGGSQKTMSVGIGYHSAMTRQGAQSVAIGPYSGEEDQSNNSVALGYYAGSRYQGENSIAIGQQAGSNIQGNNSVAIGLYAGRDTLGINSIAIGSRAGYTLQANNSIILNATGANLDQTTANTFTVKPIRNGNTANVLYYDNSTGEITYDTGISTGNVTFDDTNIIGTGNLKLQPDDSDANAYLDIYLTSGPDIHIAGNGETIILGTDDFANVTVGVDGNVYIQANTSTPQTWQFGNDGRLTFPGTPRIDTDANNFEIQAAEAISLEANTVVNIYTDSGNNAFQWQFGDDGNLTLPTSGQIIVSGGLVSSGASPAPTINGFSITNSVGISGSGNIAGGNISVTGNIAGGNISAGGTITSTGKIGYASGSTVTQTTNRGNGVIINSLAGTIITVSASMVAGEISVFSVTNNQVDTSNDIVLAQIVSPNLGNYNLIANPNSGVSGFYLTLQNISGFPISAEAVTIRFMVIKAPNA